MTFTSCLKSLRGLGHYPAWPVPTFSPLGSPGTSEMVVIKVQQGFREGNSVLCGGGGIKAGLAGLDLHLVASPVPISTKTPFPQAGLGSRTLLWGWILPFCSAQRSVARGRLQDAFFAHPTLLCESFCLY